MQRLEYPRSKQGVDTSYLEFPQREFPRSGIAGIPIGIPASKTALSWEFLGIPIQRGYVHTEEVLLHTEGGFGGVSYQYITKFLIQSVPGDKRLSR